MAWEQRDTSPRGDVSSAQPARLERAESHVREAGRIHPRRRRHGHGRRRRHRRNRSPAVGHDVGVFDVFGIRPIAGRAFLPADESQQTRSVVLSEAFWRARFAAIQRSSGARSGWTGCRSPSSVSYLQRRSCLGASSIWALIAVCRAPQNAGSPSAGHRTAEAWRHLDAARPT